MASNFAALMAYSQIQTQASDRAVQDALAERKRKEAMRRKQQEEAERKEREIQAKLREQQFQAEKLVKERLAQAQRLEQAKREESQRREEEQRESLLHGSKKGKARYPSSNSFVKGDLRKRGLPHDDDESASTALTREEKRERRLANEYRLASSSRRNGTSSGYSKAGKRLPGGAIDMATPPPSLTPPDAAGGVRARLAAMPNTLTKLNVVKRDTRTIDEIVREKAKAREAKVLDGEDAKEFHNWFGKAKEDKTAAAAKAAHSSRSASLSDSRSNTPTASSKAAPIPSPKRLPVPRPAPAASSKFSSAFRTPPTPARSKPISKQPTVPKSAPQFKVPLPKSTSARLASSVPPPKKRRRSLTPSDYDSEDSMSPRPTKRRNGSDLGVEIWAMFGKNRSKYTGKNVLSDEEDMEADARDLEVEEMKSARIAKKEDKLAEAEEKRREEEKRRRRKERQRRDH